MHIVDYESTSLHQALIANLEPRGYKLPAKHSHWLTAMDEEMNALHVNLTWDLVPQPPEVNIVGSNWVFHTKYLSNGTIDRYKARLVAQGYTQISDLDYSHTFNPIVKLARFGLF